MDEFLAARGMSYLKRCVAVPLQASLTQMLRHDAAADALVQHTASRLSSFTQLQRAGCTTHSRDAAGAAVTLAARWEGAVWVVFSRSAAPPEDADEPPPQPIETRRWLEPDGVTMHFHVATRDPDSGAIVTAKRVLRRVSWGCDGAPTVAEAAAGRTVPGSAWGALFGSSADDDAGRS